MFCHISYLPGYRNTHINSHTHMQFITKLRGQAQSQALYPSWIVWRGSRLKALLWCCLQYKKNAYMYCTLQVFTFVLKLYICPHANTYHCSACPLMDCYSNYIFHIFFVVFGRLLLCLIAEHLFLSTTFWETYIAILSIFSHVYNITYMLKCAMHWIPRWF